ncbi:MAG: outer membrane protein assembly factor BamA [Alphaproteobacteria bacterium]|nr:outer membrane protein assembly factor BamA [Alphaproteobacteria bacterium]
MKLGMHIRGGILAALIVFSAPVGSVVVTPAAAQSVQSIAVEGNRRVEADTIRSYFRGRGGRLDQMAIDDGVKALYDTGLFQNVEIRHVGGGRLLVVVTENAVIGRVAFEGNKKIKDEQLQAEVQSKPRGTYSRPVVQSDTLRIAEIYRRSGRYDVRVVPEIIEGSNSRVDLIFRIDEGAKTGVKLIEFVGNNAFSAARLRDVIKTHESNFLSFLGNNDIYDPDRVEADRDLIRRFYLKHGYAEVQVVAALTEYDPNRKGFLVTFKIEEGSQYRVGSVEFHTSIPNFDAPSLRSRSQVSVGSVYNVEAIEKSVEDMQLEASRRGYAFAVVRVGGDRDFNAHTAAVVFNVDEGRRQYIERIDIRGNTRTRDYVIRREFDVSEGDAYNQALVDRTERRLKNLDYFKTVKITREPGSSTDRVILAVELEEKSTGDFSVSGGYSTTDGALGEVSISERNLLGRGLFAKASISYGQYARGYSLSFVEPYLLDYRVALGLDLYQRQQFANTYISYGQTTLGFSPHLGFQLREDLTLQARYSITRNQIDLPGYLMNCNNVQGSAAYNPSPAYMNTLPGGWDGTNLGCYSDGEVSLPLRKELAQGAQIVSSVGYSLIWNLLDNNKNPTDGLLVNWSLDYAGVGGDVSYLKNTVDVKYYQPLVADMVGLIHLQGGILNKVGNTELRMYDHFQMGPNLVRGFEPYGIGPRDINPYGTQDALGGTKYWGASAELQVPFWFLPKEVGLKGALYADAGGLYDYQGPTEWALTNEMNTAGCTKPGNGGPGTCAGLVYDDSKIVRSSVGVGLIWQSPFGPLRFDYAVPLTKGKYDRVQEFRFGGGTTF